MGDTPAEWISPVTSPSPVACATSACTACGILGDWQLHQRVLGLWHAHGLSLTTVNTLTTPSAPMAARRLQPLPAVGAGVVCPRERRHHEAPAPQSRHSSAEVLNDAEELVPHPIAMVLMIHGGRMEPGNG